MNRNLTLLPIERILAFVLLFLVAANGRAQNSEFVLPALFCDNMVLQQNQSNAIWGSAKVGTMIEVSTSWEEVVSTTTSRKGDWMVYLNTPEANGKGQTITVSTGDTSIYLKNVLAGEVWLCSGQSNMEMPVGGWLPNDPLMNSAQEIANADYPNIRMFTVERNKSFTPIDEFTGTWQVCTPETVGRFSAVAYFYGRKLHTELGVPIGLIHSSWSGSPAQSWVAPDFIESVAGYENVSLELAKAANPISPYNQWLTSMTRRNRGDFILQESFQSEGDAFKDFNAPDFDDSNWPEVTSTTMDSVFQNDNFNGMAWFRQDFVFEGDITKSYEIFLGPVDDLNATFINGKLVGRTEHWGENGQDQIFNIPAGILRKGKNVLAIRVIDVWDVGGISNIPEIRDQEEGVAVALGSTWKYQPTAILLNEDFYILKDGFMGRVAPEADAMALHSHTPTVLYNAMIAPLIPYTIKGAIWYQGESNIGKSGQYHTLFPAVFNSWRSHWGIGDFPFYYVQLAPFTYGSDKVAELREAQLETLREKNVGMAVTMDIGDLKTIHPPNKQDVGSRLALWALAKDYGQEVVYSGPLFKEASFKGNRALVSFDQIGGGLFSPDEELTYFEVAGEDLIFYPAKAFIKKDQVVVESSKVPKPVIVRYAWDDTANPNLFNKEGLPASPFRSSKRKRVGPDHLYPADSVTIRYHTDWTRDHYKNKVHAFKEDPLNVGDVVFIGNSITEGGGDWGSKLDLLNVKNRGISGDVTDGVLRRLDEIIYYKPSAVFLMIGINDLFNIHYQKEVPSAEYVGNNVVEIANQIKKGSPNTRVYVQTVLPTSKEFMSKNIEKVNTLIKSREKEGSYRVIDLHPIFQGTDGLMKAEYTSDGTHLNPAGYDLWIEQVKPLITGE